MWHKSIAINLWRTKVNSNVERDCPFCGHSIDASKYHRFFKCPRSQHGWTWAFMIIYKLNVKLVMKDH